MVRARLPLYGGAVLVSITGFPAPVWVWSMVDARIDEKDSAAIDGGIAVIGLGTDGRRGSNGPCGNPADISGCVQPVGGTVVATYGAIGVAVVRSDSAIFRSNLMKHSKVQGVSATSGLATRINDDMATDATAGQVNALRAVGG